MREDEANFFFWNVKKCSIRGNILLGIKQTLIRNFIDIIDTENTIDN